MLVYTCEDMIFIPPNDGMPDDKVDEEFSLWPGLKLWDSGTLPSVINRTSMFIKQFGERYPEAVETPLNVLKYLELLQEKRDDDRYERQRVYARERYVPKPREPKPDKAIQRGRGVQGDRAGAGGLPADNGQVYHGS